MLFDGEYWFAKDFSKRTMCVNKFIRSTEGPLTLLIIDVNNTKDIQEVIQNLKINGVLENNILLNIQKESGDLMEEYKSNFLNETYTKSIFVRKSIDTKATLIIKNRHPILAIFADELI
jgi:hypothetical protein